MCKQRIFGIRWFQKSSLPTCTAEKLAHLGGESIQQTCPATFMEYYLPYQFIFNKYILSVQKNKLTYSENKNFHRVTGQNFFNIVNNYSKAG